MKPRALIAEFIGVFALCFIGILAIRFSGDAGGTLVAVALAHGLAITVMIAAFGATSGAHFNPAVSFAILITKRMTVVEFLGYVIAQILGGAVAAMAAAAVLGNDVVKAGTPTLGANIEAMPALIAEIICTFFLVATIFGTAVSKKSPGQAPLYIGLSIVVGILAIGPISGAALNPARYLGPAIVGGGFGPNFWIWFVGPLVGAAIAGLLHDKVILPGEDADDKLVIE